MTGVRMEASGTGVGRLGAAILAAASLLAWPAPGVTQPAQPAKLGLCAACHGLHGRATLAGTPHLHGQDEAYLVAQLAAFKSGARDNAPMRAAVGSLSDRDLREIARWYASQGCTDDVGSQ